MHLFLTQPLHLHVYVVAPDTFRAAVTSKLLRKGFDEERLGFRLSQVPAVGLLCKGGIWNLQLCAPQASTLCD